MNLLIAIYLFVLGCVLGSFYNVVGIRLPAGESFTRSRSHCPTCERKLRAVDLIPVFSYLFLRGKCHSCHEKISPIYPFVELMTGSLFLVSYLTFGFSGETIILIVLISLFAIIFVTDIRYMLIPDKLLLFFMPIFVLLRIIFPLEPWWDSIIGAAVGFAVPLITAMVSRGGMGGGDIKLFALLGIVIGWKGVLLAFFFSTLYGAFFGVIGLIIGKLKRKKPIPFGPFIIIGTLTTYFYGETLVKWYISSFF